MDIYRHFTGGPQRAKDNVGAWMVFRLGGTEDAFLDQLRHQRVILCQLPNLRSSDEVRATVSDMGDERLVISDDEHRQGRAHAGLTDVALTLAIDNRVRRAQVHSEIATAASSEPFEKIQGPGHAEDKLAACTLSLRRIRLDGDAVNAVLNVAPLQVA